MLGPLEVRSDGIELPLGGPKQRALLALLLLDANCVVSRDRLVDAFFEGRDGSSDRALRVRVSRLRTALAADGDERLLSRQPGYLLRVDAGELDVHLFESLVAEGRRALQDSDAESAVQVLREADSLWRGPVLADVEFEAAAGAQIERLEALRLEAVEERVEAELALGLHAALASELDALVADYPLRERLRGQQMVALYRCGRQADALVCYRRARELLVGELGLEPGPRLKELEQAILRQDRTLDAPPQRMAVAVAGVPRRRLRPLALGVAAVGFATAVATALVAAGPEKSFGSIKGDSVALVSVRGALEGVVPLNAAPSDITAGFGSLWVSQANAGRVVRIDPKRHAVVATIPVGRGPHEIAAGAGDIWVVNTLEGTLSRIDPQADAVAQTVEVGSEPSAVVVSGGSVWVASYGNGTVTRISPATGRIERVATSGSGPSALAGSPGTIWAANDRAGTLARIDARTGAVVDVIHVGDAPSAVAVAGSNVWVLDRLDSTLSRVDIARDVVTATYPLAGTPSGFAFAEGALWVTDEYNGSLLRLDPTTGETTKTVRVGGRPQALTANAGLWTAVAAGGALHRGGTLRVIATNSVVDTIDPGASTSPDGDPANLLRMTNDGLVTLAQVSGPDGARLVPDLALSLPAPTDAGRSYTFRLRPRIRYSNGSLLRAADVRHTFERLFEIHSSGAAYFQGILGTAACTRHPKGCDLSQGIATDNRARTVTFRLSRPDPDFLYKLTLTYGLVLPAATPGREAHSPLPATGPYTIVRYTPHREVQLARNPHFREWSATAQPAGYPDQIVMRLGLAGGEGPRLLAHGGADFMGNVSPIPSSLRDFFLLRHPSQVRTNPALVTNFLFLNVHARPFDDSRVRRALNYALDRGAIVRADGGLIAVRPTCQLLPPQLPGYRPYCPYTRSPGSDGLWSRPDLVRARALVAASGTKGMHVTVWDTRAPQVFVNEGHAVVAALRKLGYRASLRLLPDEAYYHYTNDSRNHAQIIDAGWSVDYPAANNVIGKLTCAYFVPGDSVATTDAGGLCDPALDKRIARAALLQAVDPTAANTLWARLDRDLTDRAVWLPTVTPNEVDLVSPRVGNYQFNPVRGALIDQLWVR